MSQQNLISLTISDADLAEIKGALATLKTKFSAVMKNVTVGNKKELPKMGDKTVAFVEKSLQYCATYPALVPAYLDVAEFKSDVDNIVKLREVLQSLEGLTDMLDDTVTLLGSDAYQAALVHYNAVKGAMKTNVANAATVYADLSQRFPGTVKKTQ